MSSAKNKGRGTWKNSSLLSLKEDYNNDLQKQEIFVNMAKR
jgi:hypothetical protein